MEDERRTFLTWLNDAYAMEQGIIRTLKGHAKDAADFPEAQEMIEDHIEETESQAERVRAEIERLGGDVSEGRELLGKAMGAVQGVMPDLAMDKVIKNAIAEHATEHFEMASYQALMITAERLGETETARVCEEIMKEEIAMADRLEEGMPRLINQFFDRE